MAKKFTCPDSNLEKILRVYNEALFFLVFRKPDKVKIKETLKKQGEPAFDFEPNLDYDVERAYEQEMQRYEQFRQDRELVLTHFGLNEDEIQEDLEGFYNNSLGLLKRHVERECPKCRYRYLGDNGFVERLLLDFDITSQGNRAEYDPEERRRDIEGMYLGLLRFNPDDTHRFDTQSDESNPRRPR